MAMQYSTIFYGGRSGIDVAKASIGSVETEVAKHVRSRGGDPKSVALPGLGEADRIVKAAVKELQAARKSELAKDVKGGPHLSVSAGIDPKGHLSATVSGLMPPPKKGKPAVHYERTAVICRDFRSIVEELTNDDNVMVDRSSDWPVVQKAIADLAARHHGDVRKMTSDKVFLDLLRRYHGDSVMNREAQKQAAAYARSGPGGTDGDFGEIDKGIVILAAHGSRVEAQGMTLGTKLGRMKPLEIAAFLTEQKDPASNLSRGFKGTVVLAGCFAAADGIAPEDGSYDHDDFAAKVLALLKRRGVNCKVTAIPFQPRGEGGRGTITRASLAADAALEREVEDLGKSLEKLSARLRSGDATVVAAANKKVKAVWAKLRSADAAKEMKTVRDLVEAFGLEPVR